MIRRRLTTLLLAPVAGVALALAVAAPAQAAVTAQQKAAVMSSWSQPSSASYNAWNSGRLNQASWTEYSFDWSTDYCSTSPDQPLGFDFRLSCHRHDFGYRNYKAVGTFGANKSRIDDSLYVDLLAKCATYNAWVRPACTSLAWTYYQAVKNFGSLAAVSQKDLDRAANIQAKALEQRSAGAA